MSTEGSKRLIFRRAVGAVIDSAFIGSLIFGLWYLQPWFEADETGNWGCGGCILLIPTLAMYFGYFGILESRFGWSLGKTLVGLRVEQLRGGRPSLTQAVKRHLIDLLDFQLLGLPAIVVAMTTDPPQRLGDLWARTRVVLDKQVDSMPSSTGTSFRKVQEDEGLN
jgi:uncharacterized RDD family membrane protein YckC